MPSTSVRKTSYLVAIILIAAAAFLALVPACGKNGNAKQARGVPGDAPGGPSKEAPVPVAIAPATQGEIASYYTATATLAPQKEAQILARVSGVVEKRLCEEGDEVKQGQELLLINNDEYQYRLKQAEAARADLDSKMERMKKMHDQDLVSAEEYEQMVNDLAAAKAAEGLARLNLSYTRVTAPFSGRIVTRSVDVGQTVNQGTPLFTISDFTPLLARVHVPAKEFNKLEPNQPVDLTVESSGVKLHGKIELVSPTVDPSSGTIKVTIEIPSYPQGVRPGDFAQVRIVTERREHRTLIPKIAVINDRGEQVVYVSADSTAERRVVEVGFQDDENAEITDGVKPGERVIVKGQRTLKNGALIKVVDAESTEVSDTSASGGGS